jgi:hypothetical protein
MSRTPTLSRAVPSAAFRARKLRYNRWHFFQIVFVFTYAGVVLDILTTSIGVQKAGSVSAYEQNPLGSLLIGNLGWIGLFGLMTLFMLIAHFSLRHAYQRVGLGWLRFVNGLMLFVGGLRWFAVITSLMYVLQPIH